MIDKTAQDWESVCQRCSRCCHEKIEYEGSIYYTETPCEFLDLKTRLCRVYPERDVKRPGCIRLTPDLVGKGFLPADCPYVSGIANYRAPKMADEPD